MTMPGRFIDPDRPPTRTDVQAALGSAWRRWQRLADWMAATYGIAGEPLFTGRDSGWAVRFRRGGKALLTLAPQRDGGFRALVVIGPTAAGAVALLNLGPVLREAWENARAYPDGRWLFVPVDDAETVDDIERLIVVKSPPPRRLRRAPAGPPRGQVPA
jgi:hypothetical protein